MKAKKTFLIENVYRQSLNQFFQLLTRRMKMKRFLGSLALLTLITAFTMGGPAIAQADVVKEIMMKGEMVVGVQTQGPPISFIDKNGKRTGLAVEMLRVRFECWRKRWGLSWC
jgi:hypothetical protein